MQTTIPLPVPCKRAPWNKGRLIGQKRPLKPKDVWAIRVRLQLQGRKRDLALFNLAIDSKLSFASPATTTFWSKSRRLTESYFARTGTHATNSPTQWAKSTIGSATSRTIRPQ
jgi:hypothetical protein